MMHFTLRRTFPEPSIPVFFALQSLDVLTNLIGLWLGAKESSVFIARMLEYGPVTGLLISKIFALLLLALAIRFKRPRKIVFLNYWAAALVAWNLVMIVLTQRTAGSFRNDSGACMLATSIEEANER
jgi:hypothetical protein